MTAHAESALSGGELALARAMHRATLAAIAKVVVECVAVGVAAGLACASARELDLAGADVVHASALAPATFCAAFAAMGWWLERRPRANALARKLDQRLELSGALRAAWEPLRARSSRSRLTALLAERVVARFASRAPWRAAVPISPALLALPCIAAAVLAWSREHASDVAGRARATLSAELASGAGGAGARANGTRSTSTPRTASTPSADATSTTSTRSTARAGSMESAAELARALDRRLADATLDATVRARVEAARTELLDLSHAGSEPSRELLDRARALAATAGSSSGGGGAVEGSTSGSEGGASSTTGATSSAPTPDRSADRSRDPSIVPPDATPGSTPSAGPWWAPRYDAVVERWIEARRDRR